MQVSDYVITCSQCKKKMGVISLFYFGVPHNTTPETMICMECLPARLKKLREERYSLETIKRIEKWMKQAQ
jgi:hypothetical protein